MQVLAWEMYPGEPFTTEVRHKAESLLSRTRKEAVRRGIYDQPLGIGQAPSGPAPQS